VFGTVMIDEHGTLLLFRLRRGNPHGGDSPAHDACRERPGSTSRWWRTEELSA